jgi:hypothetical protein
MSDETESTTYIIEMRSPDPRDWAGDGWHTPNADGGPALASGETEAQEAIERLRSLGPHKPAAEYRCRPVDSRELVRMVAAKGGMFAELAKHLDGVLDDADRMAKRQLRGAR